MKTHQLISDTAAALGLGALIAMSLASLIGLADPAVYRLETVAWAAQGLGQDVVNLFLVLPLGLWLWYRAWRGSWPHTLAWLGVLLYIAYSYVLYSFCMHFGPAFPFYVLALGLSVYGLLASWRSLPWQRLPKRWQHQALGRWPVIWLLAIAAVFSGLWLMDVLGAWFNGLTPIEVKRNGLVVNPVQVLDLALLLPAFFLSGYWLKKGRLEAWVLVPVLLAFAVVMDIAIAGMAIKMKWMLVSSGYGAAPLMLIAALVSVAAFVSWFRQFRYP